MPGLQGAAVDTRACRRCRCRLPPHRLPHRLPPLSPPPSCRPTLLSPALPCLPGSSAALAREPPLTAADFAERPPPIPCAPLPADVAQQLAAGEPGLVAGWRKYSQLGALEEHRRAAAAAAAARLEQERREQVRNASVVQNARHTLRACICIPQLCICGPATVPFSFLLPSSHPQAERPARSLGTAAPVSGAASAALSGGSSSGSEGPASSGAPLARSRGSGVLQVTSRADKGRRALLSCLLQPATLPPCVRCVPACPSSPLAGPARRGGGRGLGAGRG